MRHARRRAVAAAVLACIALGALAGPMATWLQRRDLAADPAERPDAVYLVAGARDQNRRVEAVVAFCGRTLRADAGAGGPLPVLVGNDTAPGRKSPALGRHLDRAHWALEKLRAGLAGQERKARRAGAFDIRIVPGCFQGTDGEMEALAGYAVAHPEIRRLALATSPFHARRVVRQLHRYAGERLLVSVVGARETAVDRMPGVVLGELGKMLRDSLGLSRAPLLSRGRFMIHVGCLDGLLLALLAVPAYAWGAYPLLLRLAARRVRPVPAAEPARPRVAVILAAHNEERHIEARLRNLQEAEYPPDLLEICVGSDGSTDRTVAIAGAFALRDSRVLVTAFPQRRGKASVLKDLVAAARGQEHPPDVLVFTDANTAFRAGALEALVRPFGDPRVGGVCGRLVLHGGADGGRGASSEGSYWRWENRMKEMESAVDSCLGGNGAIYAMRSALFWSALPANTLVDDFVLGMKVREQGYRLVYEPRAVAEEELPDPAHEWRRRVRIGAGDYQALVFCRRCLLPRYGRFAWMFWSHKALRWFTPHVAVALAVTLAVALGTTGLRDHTTTGLAVVAASLLAASAVGKVVPRSGRAFRAAAHLVAMNAALLVGFLRFCRGGLGGTWERTPRG